MNCYLCKSKKHKTRSGRVRDNQDIKIYECKDCGLVFLSTKDHITKDHYKNSKMHIKNPSDFQTWMKETKIDDERRLNFLKKKIVNKSLIDFGCGTGGFIQLAKNFTKEIIGIEPDKILKNYFKEKKIQVFQDHFTSKIKKKKYDFITAFHVIEHLQDPSKTLNELAEFLNDSGEIIIEVPSANDVLDNLYNNKEYQNFKYWSQHLYLFTVETLNKLAKKSKLKLSWISQIQRYPISNHLYWMAKGKPGGHEKWSFLDSHELHQAYEKQLISLGLSDTLIASFKKI